MRYNGNEVIYMEDLEKILKQLYLVSGLNMSIFDINQKPLASYPHKKSNGASINLVPVK